MSQKVILDWFLTKRGKQFAGVCAGGVTTLALLGNVLPHTILLSTYRDTVRLYSKGFSVPVPRKIYDRFVNTMDILEIDALDRPIYKLFMTAGFDVFSMGTLGKFGIHIAIPINFTYGKEEDIDKSRIKVNLESVVWDSDAGRQLISSLVLSENAQMYAMAREIKIRSSSKFFLDTFYATFACFSSYAVSQYINRTFNMYSRPRPFRIFCYSLVGLITLGQYFMCKDMTQNYYEKKIDKELKESSRIFAEGGKEFYTKILERNKALRTLMGKEGESLYSVSGNENYFIRSKHLPLVHRKKFFEVVDKPKVNPSNDDDTQPLPS